MSGDGVRDLRALTACAAPFVAMEFDQFGDVTACCANVLYPLGNVGTSTLREIWDGARARSLRAAVLRGDLNLGCGVCRHRLDHGYGELARDYYDNFPMTSLEPEWPFSLQFSMHNTCNLECVMCGADRSSKIRSRRAHLAPLPHRYDDAFFEQIGPFLEHAGAVDFSGGEPFLVNEHLRIWDMLAEMDRRPLCSLTTNGTVWNDRVEHILDRIDSHICVSIDGTTPATFEAIRVGASFDAVMTNLDRFHAYTLERGTDLTVSWSLVRQNWFELGAMLLFCERRGIPVKVQTVIEPEYGVQRLATPELMIVVESLEAEGERLAPLLSINRGMWDRELTRLRRELENRRSPQVALRSMEPPAPDNTRHVQEVVLRTLGSSTPRADEISIARAELLRWNGGGTLGEVDIDPTGRLRTVELGGLLGDGVVTDGWLELSSALDAFEEAYDGVLWIAEEFREPERTVHLLWIGREHRDKVGLLIRMISVASANGVRVLIATDDRLLGDVTRRPPGAVAVALSARRSAVGSGRAPIGGSPHVTAP